MGTSLGSLSRLFVNGKQSAVDEHASRTEDKYDCHIDIDANRV